jgi:hypothetical protein
LEEERDFWACPVWWRGWRGCPGERSLPWVTGCSERQARKQPCCPPQPWSFGSVAISVSWACQVPDTHRGPHGVIRHGQRGISEEDCAFS